MGLSYESNTYVDSKQHTLHVAIDQGTDVMKVAWFWERHPRRKNMRRNQQHPAVWLFKDVLQLHKLQCIGWFERKVSVAISRWTLLQHISVKAEAFRSAFQPGTSWLRDRRQHRAHGTDTRILMKLKLSRKVMKSRRKRRRGERRGDTGGKGSKRKKSIFCQ
jgi:hypothetical protein